MSNLVEFLRARLDEDEQTARAMQWDRFEAFPLGADTWAIELLKPDGEGRIASSFERAVAEHIARHDPDRILRKVKALKQVIDDHSCWDGWSGNRPTCRRCYDGDDVYDDASRFPCLTLRALAAIYDDHPEYQPEWRP